MARGGSAPGYRAANADHGFSDLDYLALPAVLDVRRRTGKADEHPEPPGVDRFGAGPAGQFGDRLLTQQRDRVVVVARTRIVGPHKAHWLARRIAQHRIPRALHHSSGDLPRPVEIGDHRRPWPGGAVTHLSFGRAQRDPPAPRVISGAEPDKPARLPDREQPVAAVDHEELAISRRACPQ